MAAVNPYLSFSGNAEVAFEFYRSVFGTEFIEITRFNDVLQNSTSEADMDKIQRITLPIGKDSVLIGSDKMNGEPSKLNGDNYHISVSADNEDEAQQLFNRLATGGHITMPLKAGFQGSLFGMLTDKFGVQWMIVHQPQQS